MLTSGSPPDNADVRRDNTRNERGEELNSLTWMATGGGVTEDDI